MAKEVLTHVAAEFLGVARITIYKLIYGKKIKAEKKWRDYWVNMKSLEEYKRNRRRVGKPMGTVWTKPPNNQAGTGEAAQRLREYQRNYKRKLRAGEPTTTKKRGGQALTT